MIVKICGLTRPADARVAVECGATAIGMVFWPDSPRAVTLEQARAIADVAPAGVLTVGVFVNPSREELEAVMTSVPLGAVQLHGDESPAFVGSLPWPVIKGLGLPADEPLPDMDQWGPHVRILLDAHDPVRRGGTGRSIDWTRAASLARRRPVILAGGLHADNVATAIGEVAPAGIDVSSGVESAPGIKDGTKLEALFRALRRAGGKG
jgi:phosphoribosylanthranilate isomerase